MIWFYAKQGRHLRCEVRQLVDGDRFHVVRPRRTYEELIALDSLPDWLE